MIDVGYTTPAGHSVESQDGDFPAWILVCPNSHRFWASTLQVESNTAACPQCPKDAAIRLKASQIAQEARDEIDREDFTRRIA
jgi:hypothetical protein